MRCKKKKLLKRIENFLKIDIIIKNTYKTLMTGGMNGCYVYCTNKELSSYLKKNI